MGHLPLFDYQLMREWRRGSRLTKKYGKAYGVDSKRPHFSRSQVKVSLLPVRTISAMYNLLSPKPLQQEVFGADKQTQIE